MQRSFRFMAVALLLGSYLLSACAGTPTQAGGPGQVPTVNSNEVLDAGSNGNDSNSNDDNANTNANDNAANDNTNVNDNANDNTGAEQEFHGVVEAVTDTSITINGVTYTIADFTEFKDIVSVGDQVKIHVIVGADGALVIREIELSLGGDDDNSNDNSNGNSNDNDDDDDNSNGNSNDNDDDDDNSNSNSNDNDDDNDNSNDNSNDDDDNGNDDNSNDNG
ncbi:MAG: hypothetical protein HUU11_01755 [Anaerolineales bacterium]|nr:hypothetical protein [Anaerolineales bacterium]